MECLLGELSGSSYESARQEFCHILDNTKCASSLVENLNSMVRVYMNLKRMVPKKYFILLKVYFNTRKYHCIAAELKNGKEKSFGIFYY